MAYRLRCNNCGRTFMGVYQNSYCPSNGCGNRKVQLLEEVLDIAVDVAVAYVAADIVTDVASSVVSGLFDW